jgi:hypothetical protein
MRYTAIARHRSAEAKRWVFMSVGELWFTN